MDVKIAYNAAWIIKQNAADISVEDMRKSFATFEFSKCVTNIVPMQLETLMPL